jgi:hypothetical protein
MIDFDVFTQDTYFVYVIKLTLSSHLSCDMYRVHAFPNRINSTTAKSTFIQPEKEFVLIDKTKAILHPSKPRGDRSLQASDFRTSSV